MAHRGGFVDPADELRENTLHAFGRAIEMGYRYLETDVRTTSDGRLMAFHDPDVSRITGSVGSISDLTFDGLRAILINGIDTVPTMDELFEAFPTARFNIDIKEPRAAEPLLASIRAHRADDRVCVASFDAASLRRFRKMAGHSIATAASSRAIGWSALTPFVPRLLNTAGQVFQVPVTHELRGRVVRVVGPRLIKAAHARGKKVHVWTINDADEMHRLIDLGVDGLISDRIDVLKQVAIERGLWT